VELPRVEGAAMTVAFSEPRWQVVRLVDGALVMVATASTLDLVRHAAAFLPPDDSFIVFRTARRHEPDEAC
jgi:hypothetical protein